MENIKLEKGKFFNESADERAAFPRAARLIAIDTNFFF